MTAARSAGILLFRRRPDLEVWIAHMGGPFWARKDDGAWSIPKGLVEEADGTDDLATAKREFGEEMGSQAPDVGYELLGEFAQSPAKTVVVFTAEAEFAPASIRSNTVDLEWPPRSGRLQSFPEVDDATWFSVDDARRKLVKGQGAVLDALIARIAR